MIIYVLLFISVIVSVGIRRIFFHPLSGFSGPKLAAISGWYEVYYDIIQNGGMLDHLRQLHELYGSFTFTDIAKAKERRAILSPLFSRRSILKLEGFIQQSVDTFISRLLSHKEPLDLNQAIRSLSTDIITSYCFATSFNTLDYPGFEHPMIAAQRIILKHLWIQKHFPAVFRLPSLLPRWLVLRLTPAIVASREKRRGPLERQIEKYMEKEEELRKAEHDTVFHHLLVHRDKSGAELSKKSLLDEAMVLLGAGSGTVTDTCVVAIANVLRTPAVREKLVEELREAWPDRSAKFGYTALEKLPYLTAFIKECLRCSHGIVSPLPRIVGPGKGNIAGYDVPRGAVVSASCVFLHENPDVFENPQVFSPERWIQPHMKEVESAYLVPFSRGPRMCLGINLAWAELYLILGNVLRKLDIALCGTLGKDDYVKYREVFAPQWICPPLQIQVSESKA
ncbi:hypothetical protein V5O48_006352 [Marasmius crinis-equi]|uniref:Cytochrome P450 n=1 Tax=Marasmius crinis-equi TaxID=585013 RepID=A0ABR3FJZ2_9AGAR